MNPLLDELRLAFPSMALSAAGVFHMYTDGDFCERAVTGLTWEDVDQRLLVDRSDALGFLDDDRFVSWLPIYLNILGSVPPERSSVHDTLLGKLLRPDKETSSKRQQRRFDAFADVLTVAQRRVVARSLQQFIENHPWHADTAQLALHRYWRKFAPSQTFHPDPLLEHLRGAFPPHQIAKVFVEHDWQYRHLYDYQHEVEGKTWEQLDRLFMIRHADALEVLNERAVLAVLPMHLHLTRVFAPTWANAYVIAALDRVTLNAAQQDVIARYRAAFA